MSATAPKKNKTNTQQSLQKSPQGWLIKTFNELSLNELYDILKLRIDVFVVEQTCYYPDLDDLDRLNDTHHIFYYDQGKLQAYCRILPKGATYSDYISIGRVATHNDARKQGLGHQLIQQAIDFCQQHYPQQAIKISAQQHLENFYKQHDFYTVSEMYLEDDIPHIAMLRDFH